MAGGKLTPRQKMINLMYLVFVAMLALNMSKEVLSAFGLMNEKFENTNKDATLSNSQLLQALDKKATDAKGDFIPAAVLGHKVEVISKNFSAYIESLKNTVVKGTEVDKETGKLPYEAMDKGQNIDESWFGPNGYSAKGTEVVKTIEKYKSDMKSLLGSDSKYKSIVSELDRKFDRQRGLFFLILLAWQRLQQLLD
jgi:gliding motility-associated protein GldM